MGTLIHLAEIAALLAVVYSLGWGLGFAARWLGARRAPTVAAAIPADRLAAATGDPLVKAPEIGPVVDPAAPEPEVAAPGEIEVATAAPAEVAASAPEPAIVAAEPVTSVAELAADEPQPEALPGPEAAPAETPPAQSLAELVRDTEDRLSRFARFRPKPAPAPEPPAAATVVVPAASPASRPGEAWTGQIRGRRASDPPPIPAADPATLDEDAAMRAIEGGWSRVRARAMPDAPELTEAGAAIAAAQVAVEEVVARTAAPAGEKPAALTRPGPGGKDDLSRISGLGLLDESTLNNLGVYHYEQIAAWTAAEVIWLETHVFAPGRIAREGWQAQAQDLAAAR